MSTAVPLPALGESVTEGTISRWLKQVGDTVAVDEPLVEISTDKVDTEIPSPISGIVLKIYFPEDATVAVGSVLALIGDHAEHPAPEKVPSAPNYQTPVILTPAPPAPTSQNQFAATPTSYSSAHVPNAPEPVATPIPQTSEFPAFVPQSFHDPNMVPPSSWNNPTASIFAPAEPDTIFSPTPTSDPGFSATPLPFTAVPAPATPNPVEVLLPALGESITEGTVSKWLKQIGDQVNIDEPLVEVSTDKVDTEIPSPVAGILLEIRILEDSNAEIGAVLAIIDSPLPSSKAPQPSVAEPQPSGTARQPAPEVQPITPEIPALAPAQEDLAAPATPTALAPTTTEAAEPSAPVQDVAAAAGSPSVEARHAAETAESYVTPVVRKIAAAGGIDLSTVVGTGVGGRIRKQDVLNAIEAAKQTQAPVTEELAISVPIAAQKPQPKPEVISVSTPSQALAEPKLPSSHEQAPEPTRFIVHVGAPSSDGRPNPETAPSSSTAPAPEPGPAKVVTTEKISRHRATIAKRMVESPQLTATIEVDLTGITRVIKSLQENERITLGYLEFITRETAQALRAFPKLNASIDTEGGTVTYPATENIGITINTDRGVLTPVLPNAGDLNLIGLGKAIRELRNRTLTASITPDDLVGATFTICDYGSAGTLLDTPVIIQPQVGILGIGAAQKRPVVVAGDGGDSIAIREISYLSLSYDQRLIDAPDAGRFLSFIKGRLEGPFRLGYDL